MSEKPHVDIYTDGAARGNPEGPGGYGAIIRYVDSKGTAHEKELSEGFPKTSNNRMELMAPAAAMEALNRQAVRILKDCASYKNARRRILYLVKKELKEENSKTD